MEQFNLNKWLKDKSRKICTRDGRPVRIVCWDKLGDYPIIGCIKYSDDYEDFETYNIDGSKYSFNREDPNDLFFADEEEELTEFEKVVDNIINYPHFQDEQAVKQFSKTLLDLARKELEKDIYDNGCRMGYDIGKQDALKSLPKWKKIPHGISRKELLDMMHKHIVLAFNDCVDYYYLDESDLRKLPKEE